MSEARIAPARKPRECWEWLPRRCQVGCVGECRLWTQNVSEARVAPARGPRDVRLKNRKLWRPTDIKIMCEQSAIPSSSDMFVTIGFVAFFDNSDREVSKNNKIRKLFKSKMEDASPSSADLSKMDQIFPISFDFTNIYRRHERFSLVFLCIEELLNVNDNFFISARECYSWFENDLTKFVVTSIQCKTCRFSSRINLHTDFYSLDTWDDAAYKRDLIFIVQTIRYFYEEIETVDVTDFFPEFTLIFEFPLMSICESLVQNLSGIHNITSSQEIHDHETRVFRWRIVSLIDIVLLFISIWTWRHALFFKDRTGHVISESILGYRCHGTSRYWLLDVLHKKCVV